MLVRIPQVLLFGLSQQGHFITSVHLMVFCLKRYSQMPKWSHLVCKSHLLQLLSQTAAPEHTGAADRNQSGFQGSNNFEPHKFVSLVADVRQSLCFLIEWKQFVFSCAKLLKCRSFISHIHHILRKRRMWNVWIPSFGQRCREINYFLERLCPVPLCVSCLTFLFLPFPAAGTSSFTLNGALT